MNLLKKLIDIYFLINIIYPQEFKNHEKLGLRMVLYIMSII